MKSIVRYFIKNEIAGNLLMVFLFIIGIAGMMRLKTTFFPEVESRMISVRVIYPGSSPQEIEEGVITKIEEELKGVTGIERVTSVSSENAGTVSIEVLKGYDTDIVLQDVKNSIDRINSFPLGIEPVVAYKQENLNRSINFALSGNVDLKTLKTFGERVEDELLAKEGISKVTIRGFPEQEIEIAFRESDLRAYNITFGEAANAIRNHNLEITGGTIKTNQEELLIRADNKSYTAKELLDVVIKTGSNGGVVYLHQVADVKDKWEDLPTRTYLNGKPSVVITVENTLEEDLLTVAKLTNEYVEEFNQQNSQVKAEVIFDSSVVLRQRIDLLLENGILGFVLVLIFLAMFLNWRLAFWVALAIPISFAGMFIAASMIGITINVISLFGMIIVIGILVDDGIVIAENIYQKYEAGMEAEEAAVEGAMEVFGAVFSAIITTVIAFSSFLFLDGRIGDFFKEMAIVVIFSLLFSLVEGIFILPAHIAHSKALHRKGHQKNFFNAFFDKIMDFLRDKLYAPVLSKVVSYPIPTLMITIMSLFLVIGAFRGGIIKGTFFPNLPRDNFSVELKLPAGTRESLTISILDSIERAANIVNDQLADEYFGNEYKPIIKMQKNIGPSTYTGSLEFTLCDAEKRENLDARTIIGKLRDQVGPIYEAESLIYFAGSPFGKPVSISLLGKDKNELKQAVQAVKDGLSNIPDLKDVVDNNQEGLKEVSIQLKQNAYNLGYNLRDIVSQVRAGFFGAEVQRLQRDKDEVKVWVRYAEEDRSDITKLADMRIRGPNGTSVPLSELVDFEVERGIVNINHIDGQREIRIEADVSSDKVSVSDVNTDIITKIIPPILTNYPGVKVGFEGQQREQAKTRDSISKVMPFVFLLMFFMVIITFKSVSQAMIIFATIPFGFVGVGLGHYLVGLPISFFSVLGMIALIGIMINDGLVFISAYNDRIRSGMAFYDAVIETGKTRFRPIILTSMTTIAGLGPLILEKSMQAQFLIPMAVSVSYGLVISTLIMLLFIPCLMVIVNRIKRYSLSFYENEEISWEAVEPASSIRKQNVPVYLIAALIAIAITVLVIMIGIKLSSMIV